MGVPMHARLYRSPFTTGEAFLGVLVSLLREPFPKIPFPVLGCVGE